MTTILVPYHLDEHLAGLDVPMTTDATVICELTGDDVWARLPALYDAVAASVAAAVVAHKRPVVISGDCMTSLGIVAGLQRAGGSPSIVWLDAHGDVQTPETTASGYVGGMPLRLLVGYRPELIAERLGLQPIAEEQVVLVDARDLDPPEREYLATAKIHRRTVESLAADPLPSGPIYLHIDCDVVDASELPGLRFPVPAGPSPAEVGAAVARVLETGRVAAVGLGCTWHSGHGAADRIAGPIGAPLVAWAR